MTDRNDDREPRRRHAAQNDGELIELPPGAETIDEAAAAERLQRGARPPAETDEEPPAAEPRTTPRFGSAGSGGLEFEPGPERP